MTKEEFKRKWEADDEGSGITFGDIANCAIEWGISSRPKCERINDLTYKVLKSANCVDAEEYKPEDWDDWDD